MTPKQKETLILYAMYYSVYFISKQQQCSKSAIHNRLSRIRRHYPDIFSKAQSIRNAHKRMKYSLEHAESLTKDKYAEI